MKILHCIFIAIMMLVISQKGTCATAGVWIEDVNRLTTQYMKSIDVEVTSEIAAKSISVEYPVKNHVKSHNEVVSEAEITAAKKTEKDLQNYIALNEDKQINDRFVIWKKGEKVSFQDKRGWINKGMIEYMGSNGIKINGHFVSIIDLSDETRCHVDTKYSDEQKLKIYNEKEKILNYKRQKLLKVNTDLAMSELCYKYKLKKYGDDYYNDTDIIEINRKQLVNKKYAEGIVRYMEQNGYKLFNNDFLPVSVAISSEAMRRDIRRAKQATDASESRDILNESIKKHPDAILVNYAKKMLIKYQLGGAAAQEEGIRRSQEYNNYLKDTGARVDNAGEFDKLFGQ